MVPVLLLQLILPITKFKIYIYILFSVYFIFKKYNLLLLLKFLYLYNIFLILKYIMKKKYFVIYNNNYILQNI